MQIDDVHQLDQQVQPDTSHSAWTCQRASFGIHVKAKENGKTIMRASISYTLYY